jgi:hypothetical protein
MKPRTKKESWIYTLTKSAARKKFRRAVNKAIRAAARKKRPGPEDAS